MANKTILKWAGSKARIMDKLIPHLPKARRLVEPFAGSCAVMMNTEYEEYLIADANQDLINLYRSVSKNPDVMACSDLYDWKQQNNEESYYQARKLFNLGKQELDAVLTNKQSARFLYLNRHCFNGLCRYNAKDEFNVPFGKYKNVYFPEKEIYQFAEKAVNAIIACLEWQDTLSLVDFGDGVYCDPPYMGDEGSFTKYHHTDFTHAQQIELAQALKALNQSQGNPITASNSIHAKELYADLGFIIHEIDAPRSISANGNRQSAKEIIAVLPEVC
ncbi:TPA: Dam family site-specific DNA-(adenine-N6)-methyltransferase [Proteus mirabilis]|uniref:site-specific DNA-methyltransferase (adenine-specific) n=1 Tax=Proteus mirabilis (strain HI4320) TaxID=529507 RepID=B4F0L7_PROMH|nr:Dam family site-specific DNA-(adenine-N6)-methyltransferase [Proteus mirabilis]EKT8673926.1 Dam family site-specific DNA-(adenine-N6)-methyltransferase [Proteus mirabilis]MBG3075880.1 Dam family site-specific DNA-(adenine-N6)-methyltransferase [Proteus mirabilis]MBI6383627.1 Dam family site-specific DNA-(adenine-N6)-methyltransferase [Proteus mirabilis]CAR44044.1 DNA adenine methylase [Proteus mirabilis HI4320]HEI8403850.1 Dam family site-specific DNA-(adenine-N6)-methyltransferase [Proteus